MKEMQEKEWNGKWKVKRAKVMMNIVMQSKRKEE